MRKKGQVMHEELLTIVGFVLLAVMIIALLLLGRMFREDYGLERNYFVRDMALVTSAAYAAPGDIDYYYTGNFRKYKFDAEFKPEWVTVFAEK